MRIFFRRNSLSRFVQRTLTFGVGVVFSLCIFFVGVSATHAAPSGPERESTFGSVVREVFRQMDGVASYTAQAIRAVFGNDEPTQELGVTEQSRDAADRFPIAANNFSFSGPQSGTLIINAPLSLYDRLMVSGISTLATTSVSGSLRGTNAFFGDLTAQNVNVRALTISGSLEADRFSGGSLSIRNAADIASLAVSRDLTVSGDSTLQGLTVEEKAILTELLVTGAAEVRGSLLASGGIVTNGANVDLGAGSIFASNVVYEVKAGDGVTITGSSSAPVISVESSGVMSLNEETGELELEEGTDIDIRGLKIYNDSNLNSVRSRGGCAGCITDNDVSNTLTLTNGSIDGVIIGASETAAAYLSTLAIGTTTATTSVFHVYGTATSTFGGGIDIESGCFSINGTCVAGASTTSYTGLSGTPDSLIAGAIQYVNDSGTAVTQSSNFIFDGSSFGIGTSSPSATLSVVGTSTLVGAVRVDGDLSLWDTGALRLYDADSTNYVGLVASSSLSGNTVWTLPRADGNTDEVLITDGNGQLRFVDVTSLGGLGDPSTFLGLADTPSSYATGSIPYTGTSSLLFSTNLVFDGSSLGIGTSSPSATLAVDGAARLTGAFVVGGDVSVRGNSALRFYNAANTYYSGFRASSSLAEDIEWALPTSDGSYNEVLVTDGNGNLRFEPVASVGGGVDTYLELTDTPSSFTSGAIVYASTTGSALAQSDQLVFDGSSLGIGTNNPTSELTVYGSTYFGFDGSTPGLVFNDLARAVSIGTTDTSELFNVQGGSVLQRGGRSGSTYEPLTVSSINLPDSVYAIDIVGDTAYVATRFSGADLSIVDISDPAQPSVTGSVGLAASANDVQVSGQYAYLVTDVSGNDFHVVDVSDSSAPVEVGAVGLPTSATALSVSGHHAYVTTGSEFHVIDVLDPAVPTPVTSLEFGASGNSVAVSNEYAYVVTASPNYFIVVDISDPRAPTVVSSSTLSSDGIDVQVQGNYAYVGTDAVGDDFHIFDISDPSNPVSVGSVGLSAGVTGLSVAGSYAYVTTSGAGDDLHIIDISDRTALVEIGSVDVTITVLDVVVSGRYAYVGSVSTGDDLHVYDISGIEAQSVFTHSLESGVLSVRGDMKTGGTAFFGSGVRIGVGGMQTDGALIVQGDQASVFNSSVGIGTSSPSFALDVYGSVGFTNVATGTGAGTLCLAADGEVVYNSGSDNCLTSTRDTKHDIVSLTLTTPSIELLSMLEPVTFVYNVDPTERTRYGFIANDVVLVDEHLGTYNYDNILTGLDTNGFLALIVGAIKEVLAELKGTQDEVEMLRDQVTELEGLRSRVEELESQLGETTETTETTDVVDQDETGVPENSSVEAVADQLEVVQEEENTEASEADAVAEGSTEPTPEVSEGDVLDAAGDMIEGDSPAITDGVDVGTSDTENGLIDG